MAASTLLWAKGEVDKKSRRQDFVDINWGVRRYIDAHGHHVGESPYGYKTSAPDPEELLLERIAFTPGV